MQMQRVIRLSYQAEPSQAYAMELNLSFSFKILFQFITRFLFNDFFNFFQQKKKLFLSFSQKHSNFKVCPFQIFRFSNFSFLQSLWWFFFFDFRHSQNWCNFKQSRCPILAKLPPLSRFCHSPKKLEGLKMASCKTDL